MATRLRKKISLPRVPSLTDTAEIERQDSTEDAETKEKLLARRCNIINELLNTESTYVEYLQVAITIFYRPIMNATQGDAFIPRDKAKQIFQNIEKLQGINSTLLKKLAARKAQRKGDFSEGCWLDLLTETFKQVRNLVLWRVLRDDLFLCGCTA